MTSVVLSIDTVETPLPAGRKFGGYLYSMTAHLAPGTLAAPAPVPMPAPPPAQTQLSQDTFVTFANIQPGAVYDASCQAVDSAGAAIGSAVMAVVDLTGATPAVGVYMAPSGLSYAVG
jgi:hypothetical protein